jgi:hypothetical protein
VLLGGPFGDLWLPVEATVRVVLRVVPLLVVGFAAAAWLQEAQPASALTLLAGCAAAWLLWRRTGDA